MEVIPNALLPNDCSYGSLYVQSNHTASPTSSFPFSCNRSSTDVVPTHSRLPDYGFPYPFSGTESTSLEVVLTIFVGIVGGCMLGAAHGMLETVLYNFFEFLHRKGKIRRLSPSIPVTVIQHRAEDFWALAVWLIPMMTFLYSGRKEYMEKMQFSGDILGSWLYAWSIMVLHDAYFFSVHTIMHKVKLLYRNIHSEHHSTRGDLTVYSTAFGDLLDVAFTFGPFYFCLVYYVYRSPSWDPLAWFILIWALNVVNMMGHSGYELPPWIYVPGSMGILLTPLAQRTKHHYIHHLDPRFNRSLYFTWWDRLGGTFREHHPRIEERIHDERIWSRWIGNAIEKSSK